MDITKSEYPKDLEGLDFYITIFQVYCLLYHIYTAYVGKKKKTSLKIELALLPSV